MFTIFNEDAKQEALSISKWIVSRKQ